MRRADLAALLDDDTRRPLPDLLDAPADLLAEFAAHPAAPWRHRRRCAGALHGRVPPARAAALFALARSSGEEDSTRAELVVALATSPGPHRAALLDWLRTDPEPHRYRLPLAVLRGRAALGDVTVARPLALQAADDWTFRSRPAAAALDGLVARCGATAVLAEFGAEDAASLARDGATVADRLAGLRLLDGHDDLVAVLADPHPHVTRAAYDRLVAAPLRGTAGLAEVASGAGPGALWALAVLLAHGVEHPAAATAPRVPLPDVPADVRAAIVARWAPGLRGTDPRWLVEKALAGPVAPVPPPSAAVAALAAAGLAPGEPVTAHEHNDTGNGTYHRIDSAGGTVFVSTLGRFVRARGDGPAAAVLATAGYRVLTDSLSSTVVDGLVVYFFGAREPLPVVDLLFYWQD